MAMTVDDLAYPQTAVEPVPTPLPPQTIARRRSAPRRIMPIEEDGDRVLAAPEPQPWPRIFPGL